jgi:plasmid stability protein
MATLNVKNLPDRLYRKLQARAKRQHRSVAQEVTHILSVALEEPEPLSILELPGPSASLGELSREPTGFESSPPGHAAASWSRPVGRRPCPRRRTLVI